jgi:hypothetical protein
VKALEVPVVSIGVFLALFRYTERDTTSAYTDMSRCRGLSIPSHREGRRLHTYVRVQRVLLDLAFAAV